MKRKYKLILIILLCSILTFLIYYFSKEEKLNIVAIGDGIASGEISYGIDGISYNDYLKDFYEGKNLLKSFNNKHAYKNYKLSEFLYDLKSNINDEDEMLYIKQILHNANIITIAFGEEELSKLSITNDLNINTIKEYIKTYDELIYVIKDISDAKLILIGYYENKYLNKSNTIILNSELSNIASKYNLIFININDLMNNNNYFLDDNKMYFNYKAHKTIAEMIIHSI